MKRFFKYIGFLSLMNTFISINIGATEKDSIFEYSMELEHEVCRLGYTTAGADSILEIYKAACEYFKNEIHTNDRVQNFQKKLGQLLTAIIFANYTLYGCNIYQTLSFANQRFAQRLARIKALSHHKGLQNLQDQPSDFKQGLWKEACQTSIPYTPRNTGDSLIKNYAQLYTEATHFGLTYFDISATFDKIIDAPVNTRQPWPTYTNSIATYTPSESLKKPDQDPIDLNRNWSEIDTGFDTIIDKIEDSLLSLDLNYQYNHSNLQTRMGNLIHSVFALILLSGFDIEETLQKSADTLARILENIKKLAVDKQISNLRKEPPPVLWELWDQAEKMI